MLKRLQDLPQLRLLQGEPDVRGWRVLDPQGQGIPTGISRERERQLFTLWGPEAKET